MFIIGIAGGTGSGKTTVVNKIISELGTDDIGVIYQDSYYADLSHLSMEERKLFNFDHPRAIDFDLLYSHLQQLREGKSIQQPVYSFIRYNRTKDTVTVHPKKVMIVEGILIFADQRLRDMFDLKIFVHADPDERLIRRIRRDITERGRTVEEVLTRYQTTLKPMHEQFIEPTKVYADIIIPNDRRNETAIEVIKSVINHNLTGIEL
ncbi:MAG: uridine kinase [Chlorobi bacterium]|nr:uridine kinase [Chlorobiota bacterium]